MNNRKIFCFCLALLLAGCSTTRHAGVERHEAADSVAASRGITVLHHLTAARWAGSIEIDSLMIARLPAGAAHPDTDSADAGGTVPALAAGKTIALAKGVRWNAQAAVIHATDSTREQTNATAQSNRMDETARTDTDTAALAKPPDLTKICLTGLIIFILFFMVKRFFKV